MSKQDDQQKKSKNVEAITALKAFEVTFKAACKYHGVAVYKPVLNSLQQCQDSSTLYSKVYLTSAAVDGKVTSAVAECLSSYAPVKTLCFYGCNIGDEGLSAVAALLRASASSWWRGCKLNTIEICADGRQLPLHPAAPERPPAEQTITKGSKQRKTKAAAASDAPGADAAEPTPAQPKSEVAGAGEAEAAVADKEAAPANADAANVSSSSPAGIMKSEAEHGKLNISIKACDTVVHNTATCNSQQAVTGSKQHGLPLQQHQKPPGVCPPVPAYLQLNFPNHMQLAQQALCSRFGALDHIRYSSQPPRPLVEVKKWALHLVQDCKQQQLQQFQIIEQATAIDTQQQQHHNGVQPLDLQQMEYVNAAATQSPTLAWLGTEACPRFSSTALQELSLSLGVAGLSLTCLVLDHTLLGDLGMSLLATGLSKCRSLKQLSLCQCNIGPAGVKALAAAMAPVNTCADTHARTPRASNIGAAAAGASRLSTASSGVPGAATAADSTTSGGPELEQLLLDGNPLTGCGLQVLNLALRSMSCLQVLGLADIGITDLDKVQLQGLVHALTVGPTELTRLDFDGNYIGDRAATLFVDLLSAKPSLVLVKLTSRLSNNVVAQMTTLMEQNLKALKAKKGKKSKT